MENHFLIEAIQLDTLENNPNAAVTWKSIGITSDEQLADRIVAMGPVMTNRNCWAIDRPVHALRKIIVPGITFESALDFVIESYP